MFVGRIADYSDIQAIENVPNGMLIARIGNYYYVAQRRVANVLYDVPNDRFLAKHQYQLLASHAARAAGGKYHNGDLIRRFAMRISFHSSRADSTIFSNYVSLRFATCCVRIDRNPDQDLRKPFSF